jgi:Zn-dependent protease with chaperone function
VLPGGKIFVFTGILKIAQTEDELAAVIGHEIAHQIARHFAETSSWRHYFSIPLIVLGRFLDVSYLSDTFFELGVMVNSRFFPLRA